MVPAGGLHRAQRTFVDPLLQRRVADAQAAGRVAHTNQIVRHRASKPTKLTYKIGWYHIEPAMHRNLSLRLRCIALITGAIVLLAGMGLSGRAQGASITVFAASDLGPAFTQIVARFEKTTGTDVTLVLGSTGMLTQQIRHGAPADVFFAADDSFINELAGENLT